MSTCRRCGGESENGTWARVRVRLTDDDEGEVLAEFALCEACASYAEDRLALETEHGTRS